MDGEGGSQHGDAGRAFWVNCVRAEICLCILRPACVETACARAVLSVNARSRPVGNNARLTLPGGQIWVKAAEIR